MPSESAEAYLELCRERLPALGQDAALDEVLTPYVRAQFMWFLVEWGQAAQEGETFHWRSDVDPEMVEHVFYAFFQCIRRVPELFESSDPEEVRLRTPFRVALTNAVLDALEAEGKGRSELARTLRETWPEDDIT